MTALGTKAIGVIADCTAEEQLVELRSTVNEHLGAVDILVSFAGGNGMPVATANDTGEHWRDVIETDLTSTFLTVSEFLPEMLACHSGVIVTMASAAARQAAKSSAAYAAAKAGRRRIQSSPRWGVCLRGDSHHLHRPLGDRDRQDARLDDGRAAA